MQWLTKVLTQVCHIPRPLLSAWRCSVGLTPRFLKIPHSLSVFPGDGLSIYATTNSYAEAILNS